MTPGVKRLLDYWHRHPRLALAVRAALASSIAWFVAGLLPDPAGDYPYYAPFGAVVATTFSLAGSVRESLQAVASIATGGVVAWLAGLVTGFPTPVTVGVVVALSVLAVGIPWFGPMGGWIPTAAIFTLIVGHGEASYIGIYAGLTLLGATIGIGVNAIMPPLPLAPARVAIGKLRLATAKELDVIADHFESPDAPFPELARRHNWHVRRLRTAMHDAVDLATHAQRGNLRGRRHAEDLRTLERDAVRLDRITTVTADLSDLLLQEQHLPTAAGTVIGLRTELWPTLAEALRALAEALRSTGPDGSSVGTDAVQEAMDRLAQLPEELPDRAAGDNVLPDAVLLSLRRALDSMD